MIQTKNVDLRREVFNKDQYKQVIDTNFSQLGVTSVSASAENTISVEEFFGNYNSIFYDIPPNGETNSHEFLVRESGQYINFDQIADEILALQEEIAGLRKELLAEQIKVIELESGVSVDTGSLDLGNETSNISNSILSGGSSTNSGTTSNNSVY
jgi:hypothetical protein|tara:strand:+ start:1095 stop:1559 length:465 start_codon:yes stop_codon:yes gene_type:complete